MADLVANNSISFLHDDDRTTYTEWVGYYASGSVENYSVDLKDSDGNVIEYSITQQNISKVTAHFSVLLQGFELAPGNLETITFGISYKSGSTWSAIQEVEILDPTKYLSDDSCYYNISYDFLTSRSNVTDIRIYINLFFSGYSDDVATIFYFNIREIELDTTNTIINYRNPYIAIFDGLTSEDPYNFIDIFGINSLNINAITVGIDAYDPTNISYEIGQSLTNANNFIATTTGTFYNTLGIYRNSEELKNYIEASATYNMISVTIYTYTDIDIGLRVYDGTNTISIAMQESTATDQVRIRKGTITYSPILVETNDSMASKVRIQTTDGIKALKKL